VVFGFYLPAAPFFGSVDFGVGFDEEEEAEPEDAAPPEF